MNELARLLELLKRFTGLAAIDWHVRTSYPGALAYEGWGETYVDLVELLGADREIRVLTYEEILREAVVAAQK